MSDEEAAADRGRFEKASVRDAAVEGRHVLLRADLNVPLADSGGARVVADDTRILAALPTIEHLRERGAAIVLCSHLGRPRESDPNFSMAPVARRLAELTDAEVSLAPAVVGPEVTSAAARLAPGEVLLLENTRFEAGEVTNDPQLSADLVALAGVFVNDAFGSAHRAHASTVGVAEALPAYAGLLLERELRELTAILEAPRRPLVVVLGGAKVADKIGVLERFIELADEILIGGAMCFTFFAAQGHSIGDSLFDEEGGGAAAEILERAREPRAVLRLPSDLVLGDRFDADAERRALDGIDVPAGWMGLDIGPQTAADYATAIAAAGTVFWNGPMGAFELEPFADGTRTVAKAVARAAGTTVVGGGDSAAALSAFGLDDQVDWLSTGGGATLELMEGTPLPAVEALLDAAEASQQRAAAGATTECDEARQPAQPRRGVGSRS